MGIQVNKLEYGFAFDPALHYIGSNQGSIDIRTDLQKFKVDQLTTAFVVWMSLRIPPR